MSTEHSIISNSALNKTKNRKFFWNKFAKLNCFTDNQDEDNMLLGNQCDWLLLVFVTFLAQLKCDKQSKTYNTDGILIKKRQDLNVKTTF